MNQKTTQEILTKFFLQDIGDSSVLTKTAVFHFAVFFQEASEISITGKRLARETGKYNTLEKQEKRKIGSISYLTE